MLGFPEIVQPRPSLSLGSPLSHLHTLHSRAVHLDTHLHPYSGQLVPQQDRLVRAGAFDGHDHPRDRFAGFEGDEQDVANSGAVFVGLVEQS